MACSTCLRALQASSRRPNRSRTLLGLSKSSRHKYGARRQSSCHKRSSGAASSSTEVVEILWIVKSLFADGSALAYFRCAVDASRRQQCIGSEYTSTNEPREVGGTTKRAG